MKPLLISSEDHTSGWIKTFSDHFSNSNLTDVTLITDDHVKMEACQIELVNTVNEDLHIQYK